MMKLTILVFTVFSIAAAAHEMPVPQTNKDFDQLKQLVGKWKGTTKMEGKEQTATVSYELTSSGTAIIERLGEGTQHEMVTMYYLDGKSAAMTHYCALGNQPRMKLKTADPTKITFEMVGKDGINSLKEMMFLKGIEFLGSKPSFLSERFSILSATPIVILFLHLGQIPFIAIESFGDRHTSQALCPV